MREITRPVSLTSGIKLNPEAVGFTRRPLHDTSGIDKGWGRNKRWEYWCVMTPDHIIALTIADIDYAGLTAIWHYNKHTGQYKNWAEISPFAAGVTLPLSLNEGPAHFANAKLGARVDVEGSGNRLRGFTDALRFDVHAGAEKNHESLGVVVPWSDLTFQYTVKDVVRPATGYLEIEGERYDLPDGSWAILDHGRGRWPYSLTWNWGAGVGWSDGKLLGLQVGGQWTDGTGSKENSLWVDGRLHIIDEDLTWDYDMENTMAPWRVTSQSVDLTLTPTWDRVDVTDLGIISTAAHQCFGHWSGTIIIDGEPINVRVPGFGEDVANRW